MSNNRSTYFSFFLSAFICCVLLCQPVRAQSSNRDEIFAKAKELLGHNPDEAIKAGLHLLSIETDHSRTSAVNRLVAEAYLVKGDYHNGLVYAYESGYHADQLSLLDQIEVLLLKSSALYDLNLEAQASQYLREAKQLFASLPSTVQEQSIANKILLHDILVLLRKQQFAQALEMFDDSRPFSANESELEQEFRVIKSVTFLNLKQMDSAKSNFEKALQFTSKRAVVNYFEKSIVLSEMSKVYFAEKNHQRAILLLDSALNSATKINNTPLFRLVNKELAVNYLALNDKQNYQLYNNEFLVLDGKLEQMEEESVNSAFNFISDEHQRNFLLQEKKAKHQFYFFLVATLLILFVAIGLLLKYHWKRKRLDEIVKYLEISRNVFHSHSVVEVKASDRRSLIPAETEQLILAKLKRFEQSTRFTSNDISLATLASQFETNTKYLSETIKKHYADNFNTYINKLRINFIIEKLKTDPNYIHYKISYLAEKSGFSSHSSFATVFKSITGITPATFIELLKHDLEQQQEKQLIEENTTALADQEILNEA